MALLQIVQWNEKIDSGDVFAWRWTDARDPVRSNELGNWTQLIVQETQEAILFRDGQALDLFGPGRYTLSTENVPILRHLINLPTGGESPFKAWVWFINKVNVLDVKWGTQTPILLRDPEYQVPLPVRAYGQFGIRVKESRQFLLKLAGTRVQITREDLVNSFRGLLLSRIGDMIATYISQKKITIFDINAYLQDMSDEATEALRPAFDEYGIESVNFFFGSINVPDDDEAVKDLKRAMSERARMDLKGYSYQQERSFDVLEATAQNTGDGGGGSLMAAGVGLGAGMGLGGAIGQMAAQMGQYVTQGTQPASPPVASAASEASCPRCGKPCPPASSFCPACGARLAEEENQAPASTRNCPKCGKPCAEDGKFCPHCGLPLSCPNCGTRLEAASKFCPECGKSLLP
ncbi:SPFH domain-containing protein [Fretibacterium fastidiosum]|uniref:Virion core protein (Lumpy skin disease virus) n=1 Tax=Fretibacterium fastidiosum TaxID=651822 RepID=A0AB94IZ13_9BACT|nr:SPFH domain-containing protein [Fretibacterium fastidiosum]CBL28958.1 Putative virion core protein (lumpy skin disease virus) [Fretibacterium fastidiosum]